LPESFGKLTNNAWAVLQTYSAGTSKSIQERWPGSKRNAIAYLNTTDSRGPVILLKTRDASERPQNDVLYCRAKPPARRTSNNAPGRLRRGSADYVAAHRAARRFCNAVFSATRNSPLQTSSRLRTLRAVLVVR
jgi:hypothetical protein